MNAAIDNLSAARLIQHEVRDQISPDGIRSEQGEEDSEEQTDRDLVGLFLVPTVITSDLVEIRRFCSPKRSGG